MQTSSSQIVREKKFDLRVIQRSTAIAVNHRETPPRGMGVIIVFTPFTGPRFSGLRRYYYSSSSVRRRALATDRAADRRHISRGVSTEITIIIVITTTTTATTQS